MEKRKKGTECKEGEGRHSRKKEKCEAECMKRRMEGKENGEMCKRVEGQKEGEGERANVR